MQRCPIVLPPPGEDRRLPFLSRIVEEVLGTRPRSAEEHHQLRDLLCDIQEAYASRDLATASSIADSLIRALQRSDPEAELYYPHLVRLSIRAEQIHQAGDDLEVLLPQAIALTAHERADENAHALVGWLEVALGRYDRAMCAYHRALL